MATPAAGAAGTRPAAGAAGDHGNPAAGDHGSPAGGAGAATDLRTPVARAGGSQGTNKNDRLRPAPIEGVQADNAILFDPPQTSLTGEMWTIVFERRGAPWDEEIVEVDCDRAHITYYNWVLIKSRLGYSPWDFLHYKNRCGNDTASLVLVDYDHQIADMLAQNEAERKLRVVLSKVELTKLQVSITPMKRPRGTTTEKTTDVPTAEEPIDAYKEWLANMQQDQPDMEFRDDYRDETIKTYKEWLRHQGFLPDILSYIDEDGSDVDKLSDDERLAGSPSSRNNWPSHARRKKRKGNGSTKGCKKGGRGVAKGFAAAMKRIKSGSQKLQIQFSSRLGGPTGDNSRSFVDEVVMFTRKRAPLIGVKKWNDIDLNVKNSIALDIMNRWDIQNTDDEKKKIWAIARDRYKGWRSTLSATFKAYNNYDARMKHKPEDLDIIEWHYLILYFGSNKFQEASNTNSNSRKKKRTNHSMGSTSFSKLSDEQRDPETGEEPSDLTLWMHTHMRNGRWSDKASEDVYDHGCLRVAEKESIDGANVSTEQENGIFQSSYKECTGCKTSNAHGHGYMSKRPTQMESMKARLEEQARATDITNQKNIELQDEVDKLNDKLANQEAETERRLEEKMQQFREEESNKLQAFREELMAAFAGRTETPLLVKTATKSIDPSEGMPTVEKSVASNTGAKSISEATPTVDKSVASNASETPSVQAVPKSIDLSVATPGVEKSGTKTSASKATRSVSQNKNYISTHQLLNAKTKRVWTRSQKDI